MIPASSPYSWLNSVTAPRMIVQAVQLYGTIETRGSDSNPAILGWAKEIGYSEVYSNDAIPWCGLFMGVVAKRADKPLPLNCLWAANWLKWGTEPAIPEFGDVLVFDRPGPGSHVALYIGEMSDHFVVLGGNQSDSVCVGLRPKRELIGARRYYATGKPNNVKRVFLKYNGQPLSVVRMD